MARCAVCGTRITGSSGYCRTHKFAVRRGAQRTRQEGLLLDEAGGAWWVWDPHGNVLVAGVASRAHALVVLDSGVDE